MKKMRVLKVAQGFDTGFDGFDTASLVLIRLRLLNPSLNPADSILACQLPN